MSQRDIRRHQVRQIADALCDTSDMNKTVRVLLDKELHMYLCVSVNKTASGISSTQMTADFYITSKYGNTEKRTVIRAVRYYDSNSVCLEVELPTGSNTIARSFFKAVALELRLKLPDDAYAGGFVS